MIHTTIDSGDTFNFERAQRYLPDAVEIIDGLLFVPHLWKGGNDVRLINDNAVVGGIVSRGIARISIKGVRHEMAAGDIALLFPGDSFEGDVELEEADGAMFICSSNRALDLAKETELYRSWFALRMSQVFHLPADNALNILNYVSIIIRKLGVRIITPEARTTMFHLVQTSVSEMFEGIKALGYESDTPAMSQTERLYKEFLTLLTTMSVRPREVDWYASKLKITPNHLTKVCRISCGRPASSVIRDYAMIDIKCQLRDSPLSIKEVSSRLGYSSVAFFGKCVKRWYGMTPSELRRTLRAKEPISN